MQLEKINTDTIRYVITIYPNLIEKVVNIVSIACSINC